MFAAEKTFLACEIYDFTALSVVRRSLCFCTESYRFRSNLHTYPYYPLSLGQVACQANSRQPWSTQREYQPNSSYCPRRRALLSR